MRWKVEVLKHYESMTRMARVRREEGSNGDREMAAALWAAGLQPWDVTMSDLLAGRACLDSFAGIVFVVKLLPCCMLLPLPVQHILAGACTCTPVGSAWYVNPPWMLPCPRPPW